MYIEIFNLLLRLDLNSSVYGIVLCDITACCLTLMLVLFPIYLCLLFMKRLLNGWR